MQLKSILLHYLPLLLHDLGVVVAFPSSKYPTADVAARLTRASDAHSTYKMSSSLSSSSSPKESDMIHWAIVGLGDVCTIKAGPAFWKCHGSTLSAVMRRTPGAAQDWIDKNSPNLPQDVARSIRAYDSVDKMMQDMSELDLDAVYVASPPGAHLENIRQIVKAKSNVKAVYIEKPCGRCAWETRAMVEELHARNIEFYPAYVSRAHERTRVLRQLLGVDKVCGDEVTRVRYAQRGNSLARGLDDNVNNAVNIPWRLNAKYSGGGLIMDMGCHILDRIDYLFGPLVNVKSTVLRKGGSESSSYPLVEDYISMSATIGESDWSAISSVGATVECVWDFSPNEDEGNINSDVDELIISGPKGSLRMAGMGAGLPIAVLDADGGLVETIEFDAPMHAAQPLIQSVVDELLSRGPSQGVVGKDGNDNGKLCLTQSPARADNAIRTSEVLDDILGSYYGGRLDEFWLRPQEWNR